MSDETKKQDDLSRRDFVAMGLAAGLVAAAGGASAADLPVKESDVEIKTTRRPSASRPTVRS
jgi:hypothetical protein